MFACILKMPLPLRVLSVPNMVPQHSQDWCALVNHIPGLKVVFPSTPYDAKGMLNTALAGSDPVIFSKAKDRDIGSFSKRKSLLNIIFRSSFGPPAQLPIKDMPPWSMCYNKWAVLWKQPTFLSRNME